MVLKLLQWLQGVRALIGTFGVLGIQNITMTARLIVDKKGDMCNPVWHRGEASIRSILRAGAIEPPDS